MRSDSNQPSEQFDEDALIKQLEEQIRAAELQCYEMQDNFTKKLRDLTKKNQIEQQRKLQLMRQYQSLSVEAAAQKQIVSDLVEQLSVFGTPTKTKPKKIIRPLFSFEPSKSKQTFGLKLSKSAKNKKNLRLSTTSSRNSLYKTEKGTPKPSKEETLRQEYFYLGEMCRNSQRNSFKVLPEGKKGLKV